VLTLKGLRAKAIQNTLFPPTSLRRALDRLGFVQADPIRSPARAQDLILRHRVNGYRAGDLEQQYPRLDIEEDFLYAYGFLPRSVWRLLHPRNTRGLTGVEARVLAIARNAGQLHPRDLEAHLGRRRTVNAWGGYSKTSTRALQQLHYRGLLRVAGREKGIRIYQATEPLEEHLAPAERLRKIVLLLAGIFSPAPLTSLREVLRFLPRAAPSLPGRSQVIAALLRAGALQSASLDNVTYVWPATTTRQSRIPHSIRFLAPFDPLVWDRRRFEHLWGWRYRFEAYTPVAKRQMGYYAMPVLWGDSLVGWANVAKTRSGLHVELGFCERRPDSVEFRLALEEETERMRTFLNNEDVG
jgi:hypothetical protein